MLKSNLLKDDNRHTVPTCTQAVALGGSKKITLGTFVFENPIGEGFLVETFPRPPNGAVLMIHD